MNKIINNSLILVASFAVVFSGCSPGTPDLVPLTAIVKSADGQPMSHLKLRLIPQDDSLDGNYIATGVTDEEGRCVLTLPGRKDSAIPACTHKVLVVEASESAEAREAYMQGDPTAIEREMAERKGRPISKDYSTLQDTPLVVDVSPNQPELEIVLKK